MKVTDTDNLIYEIESENIYENFSKNEKLLDFSNCSAGSKYLDGSNTPYLLIK